MFPAPYTNTHELNLDWVLNVVKDFQTKYTNFDDDVTAALEAIEAAKNGSIGELHAALNVAINAVNRALADAQEALSSDLTAAQTAIATDENNARNAIEADKTAAQTAIDTDKTTALTALGTALTAAISQLSAEETLTIGRINALYNTLPADATNILGQLAIINGILNGDSVQTLIWLQGYYTNNSTPTLDSSDDKRVTSQYISGIAGRTIHITTQNGYYINRVTVWLEYNNEIEFGFFAPTSETADDYTLMFPLNTVYYSIEITKGRYPDYSILTPSDIPGNVTITWAVNTLQVPTMIGLIEANTTASANHPIDSYFLLNGSLYRAIKDIDIYDTIDYSSATPNCVETTVGAELFRINGIIDTLYYFEPITLDKTQPGIITNLSAGATVDITAHPSVSTFFSVIVPCVAGDVFHITGTGGGEPRLWAFTLSNYNLVSKSTSNKVETDAELIAKYDGYLICNFLKSREHSLTKRTLFPANTFIPDYRNTKALTNQNSNILNTRNSSGRLIFGNGLSLDYRVTGIPGMTLPSNHLAYFYSLFDSLVTAYPNYITKIDCDAGFQAYKRLTVPDYTKPDYMDDASIYLYKFAPPVVSKVNSTNPTDDTMTLADTLKVFIIGGTHPELLAIYDLYHTMRTICENWQSDKNLEELRFIPEFYIMPCSGSWGILHNSNRLNYNGVDLNRNMPTANWTESGEGTSTYTGPYAGSEYETQVLIYYLEQLTPHIVIDHHNNTYQDSLKLMYALCAWQMGKDIFADHVKHISRIWQNVYNDIFGNDPTIIYGFMPADSGVGMRSQYACEHQMLGITYESQSYLRYHDGGQVYDSQDSAPHNTAIVCTLATDGFLNFLLRCIHHYSMYANLQ